MVLLESEMVALGRPLHTFSLKGIDGKVYTQEYFDDALAGVVVFMCNHCPYVKATIDRLVAIEEDYRNQGVKMIGINANDPLKYPDDDLEHMREFAKEKNIAFPYLVDETQEVAKAFKAVCTPDIFVYDFEQKLAYRGRIDDNWQNPQLVARHELREALDALVAGKSPQTEQFPSMGCSIKWKQ